MALGKKGSIVSETLGFLLMFICFRVLRDIVAEQNLLPMKHTQITGNHISEVLVLLCSSRKLYFQHFSFHKTSEKLILGTL